MRVKSFPAKRSPLKNGAPIPDEDYGTAEYDDGNRGLELQVANPVDFTSSPIAKSFELPDGWVVEERPRLNSPSHPGRVDKSYRELGTGRQFRSLPAVQRYLAGEPETPVRRKPVNLAFNSRVYENSIYLTREPESPARRKPVNWNRDNENSMQIVPRNASYKTDGAAFNLPDGWVVEHVPRSNVNYSSTIDRYYTDPETGYRFRSLRSAERYLAEVKRRANKSKNSGSRKKTMSDDDESWDIELKCLVDGRKSKTVLKSKLSKATSSRKKLKSLAEVENPMLNFARSPGKVKWVLGGPGRNLWNPFMGDSEVPESIQQTWSKTFLSSIEGRFNLYSF